MSNVCMTFTQLSIFALLAEQKSFTVVAHHLQISQSAISHAIKSLEQNWAVTLFHRDHNEVELTEAGARLLLHVREILNISNQLKQEISDIHGFHSGTLRIGSFGASSSNVLIPLILEKFSAEYPNIEVFIKEGTDKDIAQWIQERSIDVGFVVLPDERFDTFSVMNDIFVALIPKSYELSKQSAVSLQELVEHPFLMTSAGSQSHVTEMFRKANLTPKIKCHFSQILTIINMVNNHAGVSIVADMALNQELMTLFPNVQKLPLSPNIKRSIGLAVKNKKQISPIVKAFIEIAQKV